jgi:hypothetical protein
MLNTIESFFFDGDYEIAVAKQSGGRITVKRIQTKDEHGKGFLQFALGWLNHHIGMPSFGAPVSESRRGGSASVGPPR